MKLLITGASGFLGQYVVVAALRRGHHVAAVLRPQSDATRLPWCQHPNLTLVRADLQQPLQESTGEAEAFESTAVETFADALQTSDGVIHLAAAKSGSYAAQYAGTVTATKHLLQAMAQVGRSRLVAVSSFSVFDYESMPEGSLVTETAPLVQNPAQRDAYAQTKLLQEKQVCDFGQTHPVVIVRPGMIYGRGYLWNACLGSSIKNKLWLRIGANAEMPLIYVENCAEAIVLAAEQPEAVGKTLNLVDSDLPTQAEYVQALARCMAAPPLTLTIPWPLMGRIANLAWGVNRMLFRGKLKLPGLLVPARLQARFKPLHYRNDAARQVFDWQPRYSLAEAFERSCSQADLLSVAVANNPVSSV
jgi:2-alkyl-3-oxoalkanoate reductase